MIGASGAFFCLTAVILGAWFSHGTQLPEAALQSLEIAVRYQFWHGLALLILMALPIAHPPRRIVALGLASGTLLFCFTIYAKHLLGLMSLGGLTPVGGLLLMVSWAYLIIVFLKERHA